MMPVPAIPPPRVHVPDGRWAAAISGGADSVAMLLLCRERVRHVVHLDHGLRGEASAADAGFVEALARRLGIANTVTALAPEAVAVGRATPARLREYRLRLFQEVVQQHGLAGVLLGHHADDVAETTGLRVMQGAGPVGVWGMERDVTVGGVRCVRPLLGWRKVELEEYLRSIGEAWREDASNGRPSNDRNRVRLLMGARPGLSEALSALAAGSRTYREGLSRATTLRAESTVGEWLGMPTPLLRAVVLRRLREMVPADKVSGVLAERLMAWGRDAASGRVFDLPGGTHEVVRVSGEIGFRLK